MISIIYLFMLAVSLSGGNGSRKKQVSNMKKTVRAFSHACRGILLGIKNERNFRIQAVCACLAIGGGIFFQLSGTEWCILLISIAAVLSVELINTAIEQCLVQNRRQRIQIIILQVSIDGG